ncbi:Alpha/Beta hydrolase protein [Spinellus fusiger]|nr:Alpha/Beta hydrolase protein [Spinellus fusiger]
MLEKYNPKSYNHQYCNVNGIRLHYVDENSSSKRPLLLVHGWPDLWIGWREQIPFLVNLGYRVIVPSLRGFGETDAPEDSNQYTSKSVCDDLAGLLDHLELPTITVVGHDWGGFIAWKFTQFYPNRTKAVASFCTPHTPATPVRLTLEQVTTYLPDLRYQLYLVQPEAEEELNTHTREFFSSIFKPIGEMTRPLLDPVTHTFIKGRPAIEKSDALPQQILDYYVEVYNKRGFFGSLNWYKQTENNWDCSKDLSPIIQKPALMVAADKDSALPPSMSEKMKSYVPNLERHVVENSGHWILWEKPEECNAILSQWLEAVDLGSHKI